MSEMRSERSLYFPALDGWRAVAIFAVIAYHASKHLGWSAFSTAVSYGWCGVDLFFVIFGFLITGILLRSRSEEGYFLKLLYAPRSAHLAAVLRLPVRHAYRAAYRGSARNGGIPS
jgi:peptidoglycan/LPS O-acetylase OafA/YrhL